MDRRSRHDGVAATRPDPQTRYTRRDKRLDAAFALLLTFAALAACDAAAFVAAGLAIASLLILLCLHGAFGGGGR